MNRKKIIQSLLFVALIISSVSGVALGQIDWMEGKTITIAGVPGGPEAALVGPMYYWRDAWEKETGATLKIAEIPFNELKEKIVMDQMTGTGAYDGFITHFALYGDLIESGYLRDIEDFYGDPRFPQWKKEDVLEPWQWVCQWKGKWYGVPYDQDSQIFWYYQPIFQDPENKKNFKEQYGYELPDPPTTWDQVLDLAKFFNGWDWDNDGEIEYGLAEPFKRGQEGNQYFIALANTFSVMPGPMDRWHNVFYFDPDTMEPLINNPGNVRALEYIGELIKYGDPGILEMTTGMLYDSWRNRNAAMCWCWYDITAYAQEEGSLTKGYTAGCVMPGPLEVWDRKNNQWAKVDKPNTSFNQLGGNWHGVISSLSKNPDVAYHFFSYMNMPERQIVNISLPWSSIQPGEKVTWLKPIGIAEMEDFTKGGWHPNDIKATFDAVWQAYTEAPVRLENLRIPGTWEYLDILDAGIFDYLSGRTDAQTALDQVAREWNEITDRLGRETQKELYQMTIGYPAAANE